MHSVYIGIGSNLGDPRLQIKQAVKSLKSIALDNKILCSSIYQSTPMGDVVQPDYQNAVVCINTDCSAIELLDQLQQIERSQGREHNTERWGSRTIDLDLLLFDDQIINHPRLSVPHYGLQQRNFVIYPLMDIAADLQLPNGTSVRELYQSCSADGIRKIDEH